MPQSLTDIYKKDISTLLVTQCKKANDASMDLLQAPEACYLMEVLAILAACCKSDPSLRSGAVGEKFVHLKTPDSFKASLFQVVTSIKNAFDTGHRSMSSIADVLDHVPSYMGDLLEAIDLLEDASVKKDLKLALKQLNDVSTECKGYAEQAHTQCTNAINVIDELTQFSIATQGRKESREKQAEEELKDLERQKKDQDKRLDELKTLAKDQADAAKKAKDDFEKQMEQTDNVGKIFGIMLLDCVEQLAEAATMAAKEYIGSYGIVGKIETFSKLGEDELKTFGLKKDSKTEDVLALNIVPAFVAALKEVIKENASDKTDEIIDHDINLLKGAMRYEKQSDKADAKLGISKISAGLSILEKAKKKDATWKGEFETFVADAQIYITACNPNTTKEDTKKIEESVKKEDRQTIMQIHEENLKIAKQRMDAAIEREDKIRHEKQDAEDKLNAMIGKIQHLSVEETDLKDILVYLKEGIAQLACLEAAWGKVTQFFASIEQSVNTNLVRFITNIEDRAGDTLDQGKVGIRNRGIMAREATKACVIASILTQSAKLYLEISQENIKPVINRTVKETGLKPEEAKALKDEIMAGYESIKGEVQIKIDKHKHNVETEVYDSLESHGFDLKSALATSLQYYY